MSLQAGLRLCHLQPERPRAGCFCPSAQPPARSRSCRLVTRAEQANNDFFTNLKTVAKKVQGALPIVGLVSRLTAAEGGFDELSYAEFSRSVFEKSPMAYRSAQAALEAAYGRPANNRWLLLVMWMCKMGVGIVPSKDIIMASKRLRVTQDMEVEIDRFEATRDNVIKKYKLVGRPEGKLKDKLAVAVDAICTLTLGLKDGEAVPQQAVPVVAGVVKAIFTEADDAAVSVAVAERPSRALAYA